MPEVSGIAEDSPQGAAIATRRGEIFRASSCRRSGRSATPAGWSRRSRRAVSPSSPPARRRATSSSRCWRSPAPPTLMDDNDLERRRRGLEARSRHHRRRRCDGPAPRPDQAMMIGDTPYDVEAAQRSRRRRRSPSAAAAGPTRIRPARWRSTTVHGTCWRGSESHRSDSASSKSPGAQPVGWSRRRIAPSTRGRRPSHRGPVQPRRGYTRGHAGTVASVADGGIGGGGDCRRWDGVGRACLDDDGERRQTHRRLSRRRPEGAGCALLPDVP